MFGKREINRINSDHSVTFLSANKHQEHSRSGVSQCKSLTNARAARKRGRKGLERKRFKRKNEGKETKRNEE